MFIGKKEWLRGRDLNPRPLGYEPNELPDCSTPRQWKNEYIRLLPLSRRRTAAHINLFEPQALQKRRHRRHGIR